jgi:hypothetical protein
MTSMIPSAVTVSGFLTQAFNPMSVDLPFAILTCTDSTILHFCAVLLHHTYPNFIIFCCSPMWNKCWPLHSFLFEMFLHTKFVMSSIFEVM